MRISGSFMMTFVQKEKSCFQRPRAKGLQSTCNVGYNDQQYTYNKTIQQKRNSYSKYMHKKMKYSYNSTNYCYNKR